MLEWNRQLFLSINAGAAPAAWLTNIVAALASSPAAVAPLLLVGLWVWGVPSRRGALLGVAVATVAAQGVNMTLGLLWFDPRPFMVPIGHTLVAHVADNGFPSDHATLVWTLGAGLWLTGAAPRWGAAVCLYGAAVAWSRVWLGVHFPVDMLASGMVGVLLGGCARAVRPGIDRLLLPLADRAYERAVRSMRLPASLVPRRSSE